jgi:dUTP pyrophosphatase
MPLELQIVVNPSYPELKKAYEEAVRKHNEEIATNQHPNSGFDLFFPENIVFDPRADRFECNPGVDFQIKAKMVYTEDPGVSHAFLLYSRSSISKTPLMMANQVGVIDSGYRGYIRGVFLNHSAYPYKIDAHRRLVQICHPTLAAFSVKLVESLDETVRGEGGFGSTGA